MPNPWVWENHCIEFVDRAQRDFDDAATRLESAKLLLRNAVATRLAAERTSSDSRPADA